MRKVRAGIVGTGFIGPAHLEAVRRLGFVEVIAVCENGEALAREKAEALLIDRAYGSVEAMLADPDIEVIHNCTPNHLHCAINMQAMAAGKHVISEKPLAMTTRESAALVEMAERTGLVNAINFNYRGYPLVQQARSMVADGALGDVFHATGSYTQDWLFLKTDWNWRLVPEFSGESRAIADIGSHWCDLIQYISGRRIVRVFAHLHTVHKTRMRPRSEIETYSGKLLTADDYEEAPIETEDYAAVLFELDGGAVGSFNVSQCFAGRKNRLFFELCGSRCSVTWDQEQPNEMLVGYREKPNELLLKDPSLLSAAARSYASYPGGHPEAYPDGAKQVMLRIYSHIAEPGPDPDFPTFRDGHNELAICEAIVRSSRTRAWETVGY